VKSPLTAVVFASFLSACATSRPDHFYVLSVQPPGVGEGRAANAAQATLKVTLPSWVDRPEMILDTSANGVTILEHERWAAPLSDLVAQALARDIERRRNDMLVADHGVHLSTGTAVMITVDIVQMTLRRGERASLETHWRILDPRSAKDEVGGEVFSAPLARDGYAAVAQALSECLGLLADRLAAQLHGGG
jgi:uncharacterized lipoprotein YmbA